jgi:hypothetical protein
MGLLFIKISVESRTYLEYPATAFINSWMLDQYFTAKSKLVNTFFGQFALPFKDATFPHVFSPTRLATSPPRAPARPRHAAL